MDKETRDKYYRIVGGLQALQHSAKHATCMPCDSTTDALLVAARGLLDQAASSAWRYAEEMTAVGKSGDGK